jgi:regulator of sirC expression with transglutaminase-like and TPR domain
MNLDRALQRLSQNPAADVDIVEVALGLARDEYPHLDVAGYIAEFDEWADKLRLRLHGQLDDQVEELANLLFNEEGFRGDLEDYYNPENSYLNRVIDRRCGLPITLSLIAIAVGNRAGLSIEGVGLPGHFIAMAGDGTDAVMFDPFNGGNILTIADCEQLAEQATGEPFETSRESLGPTSHAAIIRRMLTNLKGTYLQRNDFQKATRIIRRILQLEPHNANERRDLGVCLVQSGRHGAAIDHLEVYLGTEPVASDVELVRQMLKRARHETARWN